MLIPITQLPRVLPAQRERAPQVTIPQTREQREFLKQFIADYVEQRRASIVPPLVLDELRTHADAVVALSGIDPAYRDYAGVLLCNEAWREQLATVPYERRLLLLPKCLRVEDKCPAPFDEFGLLCKQCGLCTIQDLQEEAEKLGYAVLVAEGSAIVMSLIQTGKIDAIVGVSCLSVLERAFPYMESAAVPGVAIPLLQDDCKDTTVDIEWIWDVIHLTSEDRTRRLDLDSLRRQVEGWFTRDALDAAMGPAATRSERIARDWLSSAGKRWRPFLTACAWRALQSDVSDTDDVPVAVRQAAIAVECFHKASLIHDDIEDEDQQRYGEPSLHAQYGVPMALNIGDLLVGEGYRLLAACDVPADVRGEMLRIAAEGHRSLCLGQGTELEWTRDPQPMTPPAVVDVFRRKTAPAFEVALRIGAALGGAEGDIHDVLARYSEALGIAYQIRDDLADLDALDGGNDLQTARPSLPLALAFERAKGDDRVWLERVWQRTAGSAEDAARTRALIATLGAEEKATGLLEAYKEQAIRTLPDLDNASLKGLLRRVVGKIFSVEIKGWCSEFEARNAAGGAAVTENAG